MSIKQPITMGNVFDGVIRFLQDQGHPYSTYKPYKTALYRMQNYLGSASAPYSPKAMEQFAKNLEQQWKNGSISKKTWYATRRAILMANEFFAMNTISLSYKRFSSGSKFTVSGQAEELIEKYCIFLKQRNLSSSTILNSKGNAQLFMHYLGSIGVVDISKIDNPTAAGFIPFISAFRKWSIGNTLLDVRHFLIYLYDQGLIDKYVSEALHVPISRRRRIQQGFSNDEVNAMLTAIDTTTNLGKRDYAILILAAYTGLRSVDIRQLKLQDIKWEQAEIHVVQSKTQKPLILPLLPEVGDALADYILNARPKLKDKPVFLTSKHPYNGFSYLRDIVEKYAKLSGVAESTTAPLTIHSFRRGLGVSMLKADVPLSGIVEVLGQTQKNSAKKYLALDVDNLRNCAMPMANFIPKESIL